MKALLGFFAFASLFNGADVRAAEPHDIVARYAFQPGYQRNPARITLVVHGDGALGYKHVDLITRVVTSRTLGTLSQDSIQTLRQSASQLRREDLQDQEPGQPHCMDTPTIEMSVVHDDGEEVVISRSAECHHFDMPASEAAAAIKSLLTGLVAFATLP